VSRSLSGIYKRLYSAFGPQYWWPADSPLEVMVGAILTQNTNWQNVEKAIKRLKEEKLLKLGRLHKIPQHRLASLIRPSGYYNIKAGRLKALFNFLHKEYKGSLKKLKRKDAQSLRNSLLAVKGIGPETADSILLYALNKPVFVIDAYTKRILSRHHFIQRQATYDEAQNLFRKNLQSNVKLFNEYHALLVKLGKEFCLKNKPRCAICPLRNI